MSCNSTAHRLMGSAWKVMDELRLSSTSRITKQVVSTPICTLILKYVIAISVSPQ